MSYSIVEIPAVPATRARLDLEVDGEVIASATPVFGSEKWKLILGEVELHVRRVSVDKLYHWLGEKLDKSEPDEIPGPDQLDQARLGTVWRSEYNGGRYRRTPDGSWEFSGDWLVCDWVEITRVTPKAYPLKADK